MSSQAELNDKQESKSERPASASSDGAGLLDHLKGLYSESGIKEFRDVLAKAAGVDDKGGSETKKADALPDLSIAGAEKGGIGSGAVDKLGKHAQFDADVAAEVEKRGTHSAKVADANGFDKE